MTLAQRRKALITDLEEQLAVIAGGYAAKDVSEVFEHAARDFHAIACCNLLLKADRKGFQKHLVWCGFAQRTFLGRSRRQGNLDDFRLARSRWPSLFCAIVAADDPLVTEIHALAPPDWIRDGEYEDDFAYHLFVSLLATNAGDVGRTAALTRFESALAGDDSARLEVCRALQIGDAAAFDDAFRHLLEERAKEIAKEREVTSEDDLAFEPLTRVFVEGLALLRLANRRGLVAKTDYPLCPSSGWLNPPQPRPDDLFAEIEQNMGRAP